MVLILQGCKIITIKKEREKKNKLKPTTKYFTEYMNNMSEESCKIVDKIIKGDFNYVLNKMCNIQSNNVYIDHLYFKHLATRDTYPIIQQYVSHLLNTILNEHGHFIVHVNLNKLTLSDFDKHKDFIKSVSMLLKDTYPDKLKLCYVYNAPIFFSQIYNFVGLFIDKETLSKVQLLKT